MKLGVAILTVPRGGDYLNETVESLRSTVPPSRRTDLPFYIIMGSPESHHIDRYREAPDLNIISMGKKESKELGWPTLDTKARCALGHYRAMTYMASVKAKWSNLLILEDDVEFSAGWATYLGYVISELRAHHGNRWILTLYRIPHGARSVFERGLGWYQVVKPFHGTQGVVYPREIISEVAKYLLEHCIKKFVQPVDDSIGEMCQRRGIPMCATAPSLVQHRGRKSTGQSRYFHTAAYFLESVENVTPLCRVAIQNDPP